MNELKEAENIPAHKKKSKISEENYFPNISKVYERCLTKCHFFQSINAAFVRVTAHNTA